jgi:hydroxyacid-oxoacid transhydrogenase
MAFETAVAIDATSLKYGAGATREVGYDLRQLGVRRAMVVIDPNLTGSLAVERALASLKDETIDAVEFAAVRIEPSDVSFKAAIEFAKAGAFEGFLAIGGGATMDTAKAANLYSTYPGDFLDYVNAPLGKGLPAPGRLKPLVAVPTTAGSGSETSAMAICGLSDQHVKTAIAQRALRPRLAVIDPDNIRTVPRMVAACAGMDVLIPALESVTALPFFERPAAESPGLRPAYQGSNPISDIWTSKAAQLSSRYLLRYLDDPDDDEAREQMFLASTFSGIGLGNAGVTLPHGMSYAVSGMVRDYMPPDYSVDHPMIPHGMAVALTAPAAFRFMAPAAPELFLHAARLIGADTVGVHPAEVGDVLATTLVGFMRAAGMPNGLTAVGYTMVDIDRLVEGTLPQHRVIKLSRRQATAEDFRRMFEESMTLW